MRITGIIFHEKYLFSSRLARVESSKSCNLIGSESGFFFRSCQLTRAESLAASFTSLFVICDRLFDVFALFVVLFSIFAV